MFHVVVLSWQVCNLRQCALVCVCVCVCECVTNFVNGASSSSVSFSVNVCSASTLLRIPSPVWVFSNLVMVKGSVVVDLTLLSEDKFGVLQAQARLHLGKDLCTQTIINDVKDTNTITDIKFFMQKFWAFSR